MNKTKKKSFHLENTLLKYTSQIKNKDTVNIGHQFAWINQVNKNNLHTE